MTTKLLLQVESYEELRDNLSTSGLFDLLDCDIEIECPLDATTEELGRITTLLESVINVTDILILTGVYSDDNQYNITIRETPAYRSGSNPKSNKKN
jgi:hypothetical protein